MKFWDAKKIKTPVVLLTIVTLILPIALKPQPVQALTPVRGVGGYFDVIHSLGFKNDAAIQSTALATKITAGLEVEKKKEAFLRAALKKYILNRIVNQIINWIQGGGEPQFITNWGQFLADAGNAAAGGFLQEIGAGFLCQPFSYQIQIALTPTTRFDTQVSCTLDQVVSNVQNFYQNFENGGWIAYREALRPQNNIEGALMIAGNEQIRRTQSAGFRAWTEGLSGGGWLSKKNCDPTTGYCAITIPGDIVGNLVKEATTIQIKGVLDAEELSDYAAAIADALFNRLIIAGVNGLQGISTNGGTNNLPNDSFNNNYPGPSPTDACDALTGDLATQCQLQQCATNTFATSRALLIANINKTLNSLASSSAAIQAFIDLENAFLAFATSSQTSATKSQCVNPAIDSETARRGDPLQRNGLYQQLDEIQANVTALNTAKTTLNNLTNNSCFDLQTTHDQISSFLNQGANDILKQQTADQKNVIAAQVAIPTGTTYVTVKTCLDQTP